MRISIRVDELLPLADRLVEVSRRVGRMASAIEAVNQVVRRSDTSIRRGEIENISLTPAYVKSKTDVTFASIGTGPKGEIRTKGDLTILGRFSPLSRVKDTGAQRRAGPIAGWRSAGTRVSIKRTEFRFEPQWFIMRLRRGREAGVDFGVFVRDDSLPPSPGAAREGRHGKRHIYGPSPYSLMREQVRRQYLDISNDLAGTALKLMGDEIEGGLR